jgi:DNA-binding IclR family transcriptional regulator
VDSEQAVRIGSRVGLLLPAHSTSGGKVLSAQLSDPELMALYPDRSVQLRDGALRSLATLRRELATIRRQRYAPQRRGSYRQSAREARPYSAFGPRLGGVRPRNGDACGWVILAAGTVPTPCRDH